MLDGPLITLAIEASNPSAAPAGVAFGESPAPSKNGQPGCHQSAALGRLVSSLPGTGKAAACGGPAPVASEQATGGTGGQRVLGVEPLAPTGRHDDDLVPAIDRLARRLGIKPANIARVAVSVGPGGYTSLRTAIAAAKMIAEAAGAACVAVPSAMVVAARARDRTPPPRDFAVLLASKNDSAHATVFRGSAGTGPTAAGEPIGLITAADLAGLGVRGLIADSFLPPPMRAEAERLGLSIEPPTFDPAACFECSMHLPDIDPADLMPAYPREPDAVTQWRRRAGSAAGRTPPA